MALDFTLIAFGFVVISLIVTFLLKKFAKADTYFIISLLKTQKPLAFFDKMARHKKFLDIFSMVGLLIGFGALSADFFYGRKLPIAKRLGLFVLSFTILCAGLVGIDSLLGNALSQSSLIGGLFPLMVFSFGAMGLAGFTLFSLVLQAFEITSNYLLGLKSCPGVAPLIPGVQIPGVPITPPLHAWISLLIILLVHEGAHGIVGRRQGFTIKSTGVVLLGFLPVGAFVEPDEKQVREEKEEKVLPFLAAGPMANLALMGITGVILALSLGLITPVTDYLYPGVQDNLVLGVGVGSVLENTLFCGQQYPSSAFGQMQEGDIIRSVNGAEIKNAQDLFSALQQDRFSQKTFALERTGKLVTINLTPNELGQFGFVPQQIRNENFPLPESFSLYATIATLFVDFIYWLFLLNFLVASINFLPMHPFDGGRIAKLMIAPYLNFLNKPKEELQKIVEKFFLYIILALLLVNALPLFI